ncbi:MAG: hypothetical protein WA705_25835 [Candidatus Ozemobacteraceae bacterium]
MKPRRPSAGQGGIILLVILIAGLVGLYFGSRWYYDRYYVSLYDGEMTRYFEIPPFAQRKTPVSDELKGTTVLELGIAQEQANTFIAGMANRKGFVFRLNKEGFEIEITPQYKLFGRYKDATVSLSWKPRLPARLVGKVPAGERSNASGSVRP